MEARAAEARAIERRLISALEAASRAESEAATCMEVIAVCGRVEVPLMRAAQHCFEKKIRN